MEKRDKYELILKSVVLFLSVAFIVIITLFITGNITLNNKSNNNQISGAQNDLLNTTQNNQTSTPVTNTTNDQNTLGGNNTVTSATTPTTSFDAYANYKNTVWSTNVQYMNDSSNQNIKYTKMYIYNNNAIKVEFSDYDQNFKREIYTKSINVPTDAKIKCFEYVFAYSGDGGLETLIILMNNGELYYVKGYNKIYSHNDINAEKISSSNKVLEIVNKKNGQPSTYETTGIYALLDNGKLASIDYKTSSSNEMTCILGNAN